MFETVVVGWVTIISVSHIPYSPYFFHIDLSSLLSLACALEFFFHIALLTLLHQDRGPLVYASFMSLELSDAFFSHYFSYHHTTAFHHISLVMFFISSYLFYLLLVLLHVLSILSGDPPQFITWRIVISFPLSIPQTLIQRSLVWEGHLVKESLC